MENYIFNKRSYAISLNKGGQIESLNDKINSDINWVADMEGKSFGTAFINGTQQQENLVECEATTVTENSAEFVSSSGSTVMSWNFGQDDIALIYKNYPNCGPRMGMNFDLNLLDLSTGTPWQSQCMPTTIYTSPTLDYAYFIFSTADKRFMTICIDGDFAAWRLKYSEMGHRIIGFQVLSQADDVLTTDNTHLPVVDCLNIKIGFAQSIFKSFENIVKTLDIAMLMPKISGCFINGVVPFTKMGNMVKALITNPLGDTFTASENLIAQSVGEYIVACTAENSRVHYSSVYCQEKWSDIYNKSNFFYAKYAQHECGGFSRVLFKDTLSSENGLTFEGVHFGNPDYMMSCRTGEFGGFAAWAMIKNCILNGENPELMKSIDRYINNWAINRSEPQKPYNGGIDIFPSEFLGRKYSGYHLHHEVNYPQHEVFLMEQFADYYLLTNDERILHDLEKLTLHFITDHINEKGAVICQNSATQTMPDGSSVMGEVVDYCTVHVAISGLIRAYQILRNTDKTESTNTIKKAAMALADYVCARGLGFPTEGEPATEDGSMACTVISLMLAFNELEPKEEYAEKAKEILFTHSMLEMSSADCRMNGSSIRFWETQYESRDWGPSINAGHAWTLWTVEAKILVALHTADFMMLKDAYNGVVTNLRKIESNGGMPSCYTPDMIPGTPHGHTRYTDTKMASGIYSDMRPTSSTLAMDYVRKTYATSGNYCIIKSAEYFGRISGYDAVNNISINGYFADGVFSSEAKKSDTLLLNISSTDTVVVKVDNELEIICNGEITVMDAQIEQVSKNRIKIHTNNDSITIKGK